VVSRPIGDISSPNPAGDHPYTNNRCFAGPLQV